MSQQLVKKGTNGRMVNVNPKSWIEAIKDKNTGQTLVEILQGFNMYFLPYNGNTSATRCLVPTMLRKKGLWITYVKYDGNVYTEWYAADELDDKSWGDSSNWRIGNNTLVGDITISANGNWVINGTETEFKAVGEKGNTPLLRVANNRLQVSYDLGDTYRDVTNNPVYTKFRWLATSGDTQANNVGRIQASTDEGKTWTNMSNDFTNNLHIKKYIGVNESLPTSGIAEGTIYAKGPYYAEDDTLNDNPIYRLWVYAWKNNTLAWQDNGEFQSIAAGVVQETGDSETEVMSQKAVSEGLSELGQYVENPEYARAYTDAEGKVLWGIRQDGSVEFTKGVPSPIKAYIDSLDRNNDEEVERINQLVIGLLADVKVLTDTYHYISNPEWACAIVDAEERILMGIKADGSYYIPNREMYNVESNPEYAKVVVDSEGRVLFGIKTDGSCYIPKGISEEAKKGLLELTARIAYFEDIFSSTDNAEWLQVTTDSEGKVLEGISNDGKKYLPKQEMLEKYNDIEGRTEMTLDADGRILSYRDANGTKHEESMLVNKHLILGKEAMLGLQSALIENGYNVKSPIDWSGKSFIEIPMPRCAIANFSNIDRMPTSKTANAKAYMEVWDMNGNYFKVKAITNTQGDSSMAFAKKNFGIDICSDTDDWVGDETVTVKFGDWVSQDSFHLKAYATDTFRCSGAVCYKLYNQIMMSRGLKNDRPYKQYYVGKSTTTNASGKINQDAETNARCVPDGFPVILYLNGEFYGVYSWQLKKHRDNYQMKKSNAKHIHLDGTITAATLFDGKIDWTAFEVRNPKSLIDMDGNKYDGDNPTELSNTDEFSAEVKSYIVNLSNYISQLRAKRSEYENGSIDIDELKSYIEERFDIPSIIDYALFSNVVGNFDGLAKNWQYITYDGVKWFVADYDNDGTFGNYFNGNMIMAPEDTLNKKYEALLGISTALPSGWMYAYYKEELRARYSELKEKGILTKDNIVGIFREWMSAVGSDNYDREYTKWTNQPCYRDSLINDEYWELSTYTEAVDTPEIYDETKQYNVGDYVRFKDHISTVYFVFKCKKANVGQSVITGIYESEKPSFGHYDSIYRISNWIDKRIEIFENLLSKL